MYKFYADAFFYLHIINQYETGNYIVLDICCYRDPAMLDCMYIETMKVGNSQKQFCVSFYSFKICLEHAQNS